MATDFQMLRKRIKMAQSGSAIFISPHIIRLYRNTMTNNIFVCKVTFDYTSAVIDIGHKDIPKAH